MSTQPVEGFTPGIEGLFNVLWEEVCNLSAKWRLYLDLFANDENRHVINDTAPGAFSLIESALRSDMIMIIGRLTDPPETGPKSNLSLETLIRELQPYCTAEWHSGLAADLAAIRVRVAPFKENRNRKVGHIDKPTALAQVPDPALGIGRSQVEQALAMISQLLNRISLHFTDTTHMFERVLIHGNGEHLIFYLGAALEHFEERRRRELPGHGGQ